MTTVRPASAFLRSLGPQLKRGRVLDVACGSGRNARYFLERGDVVVGIDRSLDSLREARRAASDGHRLDLVQADLETFPLPSACFDVVVNVRYLQRSLVSSLRRALRPGGHIVFETFLVEQLQLGHPRNPDFVLQHDELRALFAGFRVLRYEESLCDEDGDAAYLARLWAEKPASDVAERAAPD